MTEALANALDARNGARNGAPIAPAPARLDVEAERALSTAEAARFLGVGKSTLERWRVTGGGPSYRKLPGGVGRVVYLAAELREFRDRFKRNNTSEQPAPQPQAA